jgi:hypothetical protein
MCLPFGNVLSDSCFNLPFRFLDCWREYGQQSLISGELLPCNPRSKMCLTVDFDELTYGHGHGALAILVRSFVLFPPPLVSWFI